MAGLLKITGGIAARLVERVVLSPFRRKGTVEKEDYP